MVPLRFVSEALGFRVAWDEANATVTVGSALPQIASLTLVPAAVHRGQQVNIVIVANDPDGDSLTYVYEVSDGYIAGGGSNVVWHAPAKAGAHNVRVRVSDGTGGTASRSLYVLIANRAPVVDSITINPTSVLRGQTVNVVALVSDPDGDPLTFSYRVSGGTIQGAGANVTWTSPNAVGTYSITVTVADGQGGTAERAVEVAVINSAPSVSAVTVSPASVSRGQSAAVTVTANDPDGDPLTYSYRVSGGTIQGAGANVTWTAPNAAGTYSITVTVADVQGGTAERTVNVSVTATFTLTLNSTGTTSGAGVYEAGAAVNVSTSVPTGSRFLNWTNGNEVVSTSASFVFTIPARDTTLVASFGPSTLTAAEVFMRVSPAVVHIRTFDLVGRGIGQGSGFIVRQDGFIVTNQHVLANAHTVTVTLADGTRHTMQRILSQSVTRDVAVIRINATNLPTVTLGDYASVRTGDQILTIGNPLGLQNTISEGLVSSRARIVGGLNYIQISAPISPGSSGGALVDYQARVIGVTTAAFREAQNLNLAIPIDEVLPFIASATGEGVSGTPTANWRTVAVGDEHSLAIRGDGTLWAWGGNSSGQLGLGHTNVTHNPTQIGTANSWVAVSAGVAHSIVVAADGSLWAWGSNSSGQLGRGNTQSSNHPVRIGTGTNWVSVAAGGWHSLAIRSDGTLWAWGLNSGGQGGVGQTANLLSPAQVGLATNWASVSAGGWHSLATRRDGSLWTWGWNALGQLGLGHTSVSDTPTRVGLATDWAVAVGGRWHSLALRRDGTLWAWGSNTNGALGLGVLDDSRLAPVRVGTDANWAHIAAGRRHSAGVRSEGSLWTWGSNFTGELAQLSTRKAKEPANTWFSLSRWSLQSSCHVGYLLARQLLNV